MDIERIATSALVSSISKTDTLRGFINDGDKEPCCAGNIYIYENSKHSKKNIRRIPTQMGTSFSSIENIVFKQKPIAFSLGNRRQNIERV